MKKFILTLMGCMVCALAPAAIPDMEKYSQTIVVAADGSGDYPTLSQALKSLKGDSEQKVRIYLKNGIYHEKNLVNTTINNLTLEGESRDGVVLTNGDWAQKDNMGTSGSYTLRIDGNNVAIKNMTIENTAGRVGQAVALHTTGDCISVKNCNILGNQDTLYASGRGSRDYFENCYIDGTVDFIFGAATALFRNCHIHAKADSYLTAASTPQDAEAGYVFHKCKVTADPEVSKVFLGRTWRPHAATYFIDCELPKAIAAEGWHNWGKEENNHTARYGEYGNHGEGADTSKRVDWQRHLSAEDVLRLTDPQQVFYRNSVWIPD